MHTLNFISLIFLTLIFVIWAVAMFMTLGRISRRSREKLSATGGGYFTWVGHSLSSFRDVLSSDDDPPARRRLIFLTVLLCVVIAGRAMLLTALS